VAQVEGCAADRAPAMGNEVSSMTKEEVHLVANFNERDIKRLYHRFRALDADGNGQLDPSEILGVKEIQDNPLTARVTNIFDKDGNGTVSFIEFLLGLARLSAGVDPEEKLRFAFEVYDVNRDGFISNGDLFAVMKMMVGDNLTDEQLQQLVDRQIRNADKDYDGLLSFQEFKDAVKDIGVAEQLTLDI
jgi:serine/threonine-protein phosphatase 2B regulatory subunit